jgi:hypothetical protein
MEKSVDTPETRLVYLVYSVFLVYLDERNSPDEPDRPDRPDEQDRLAAFFSILLILRQPGSRRPIHNRNPSKQSLRQIGVVPDLETDAGSDRRHALSCHHRPV